MYILHKIVHQKKLRNQSPILPQKKGLSFLLFGLYVHKRDSYSYSFFNLDENCWLTKKVSLSHGLVFRCAILFLVQEYRTNKEPKKEQYSFSEYHPIILSKDNLSQIIFVIFGVEADSIDNISSRMLEDKAVIRTKYNLPPAPLLTENPKEYLRMLISIAQQQKIDIRKKEEFIQFFKERFASAVYLHEPNAIVTEETQDSDNLSSLIEKIHSFEHELVHGLQKIKYPGLSQTRKEYEAYLAANISENTIQNSPFVVFERIALSLTPDKLSEEFKGRAGSVA